MAEALEDSGFQVTSAADSETALRDFYETYPDLIILADVSQGGRDFCHKVRRVSRMPIIVMGEGNTHHRVVMLEMGADIYLVEPVGIKELVAWVFSFLRRRPAVPANEGLKLNPEAKLVEVNGHVANLTSTEFRLFSCLVFNEGSVISFPQLIAQVWGGNASLDNLHFYVRRLRQKLGIGSDGECRLLNYRGEGYCFYNEKRRADFRIYKRSGGDKFLPHESARWEYKRASLPGGVR